MKSMLSFAVSLFLFSSCCDSSQGCCGDPPNPELSPEAKSWLSIYQQQENYIYEDQNNRRDSLKVTFETDTEYCGGDECGSDCKIERASLTSRKDSTLSFRITARNNNLIEINESTLTNDILSLIFVKYQLTQEYLGVQPDEVDVAVINDYVFQDQKVTAIKAQCDGVSACAKFRMSSWVVSQEKGLIEYVDNSGAKWSLIN